MRTIAAGNLAGPPQVSNTAITTAQIFAIYANQAATTTPVLVTLPGSLRFDGKPFRLRASGWATVGGTSPTLNVTLYEGSSLTPGSNTVLAALGSAQAVTTAASYPWAIEAVLQGDSKSKILQGRFSVTLDNVVSAWAALTNAPTSIDLLTEGSLQFCVGVTFGVANAANLAQLDALIIEG